MLQGGRRAQHRQRARGGRRGRERRGRIARATSRRAWPIFARWPAGCSSRPGLRDSWIIDDSYNANPSSVRAGLEVLRSLPGRDLAGARRHGRTRRVTPRTATPHIGRYARDCGVKRLFAIGPQSSRAVETFGSGGEWFADADSLTRRLQAELAPGVTVLIKGSRVNRLERVVQALTGGGGELRSHDESELSACCYTSPNIWREFY